jgi:hypothetical protein
MKTIRKHLKLGSLLLAFTIFLQSCTIYRAQTASIDEAVQFKHKIKLVINSDETYEFKELQKENDNIYGIAHKNSDAARYLHKPMAEETKNQKYVKILLTKYQLNKIHLQNKPLSTLITVAVPTVILTVVLIIIANSINLNLDWGGGI